MLIGTFELALEPSGRLILPSVFRPVACEGLTVTRGFDRCLQAFPTSAWRALARRVSDLPLAVDAARHARRLIFAAAADLAPDEAGALILPRPLLAYAEISSVAILVGMESFFEIWSPEAWSAASDQLLASVGRWAGPDLPLAIAAI